MPRLSHDDIRACFSGSKDFNELFDAFEDAVAQGIQDIELYRLLFWNSALSPDELRLFGEKLAVTFPAIAYEAMIFLARVFEATQSGADNFELTMQYYQKAAQARPAEAEPYLSAADCYEPDLNIPPVEFLLPFLKEGVKNVEHKKPLLERLSYLCQMIGDEEQSVYYRNLADDIGRIRN